MIKVAGGQVILFLVRKFLHLPLPGASDHSAAGQCRGWTGGLSLCFSTLFILVSTGYPPTSRLRWPVRLKPNFVLRSFPSNIKKSSFAPRVWLKNSSHVLITSCSIRSETLDICNCDWLELKEMQLSPASPRCKEAFSEMCFETILPYLFKFAAIQ